MKLDSMAETDLNWPGDSSTQASWFIRPMIFGLLVDVGIGLVSVLTVRPSGEYERGLDIKLSHGFHRGLGY